VTQVSPGLETEREREKDRSLRKGILLEKKVFPTTSWALDIFYKAKLKILKFFRNAGTRRITLWTT